MSNVFEANHYQQKSSENLTNFDTSRTMKMLTNKKKITNGQNRSITLDISKERERERKNCNIHILESYRSYQIILDVIADLSNNLLEFTVICIERCKLILVANSCKCVRTQMVFCIEQQNFENRQVCNIGWIYNIYTATNWFEWIFFPLCRARVNKWMDWNTEPSTEASIRRTIFTMIFFLSIRGLVFFVCVRETGMHSRSIWGDRCRFLAHLRIFESELSCRRLSFFKITTVFFVGPFIYNAGFKYYPIVFWIRTQYFLAPHRRAIFLLIFQFPLQL